MAKNKPGKDRLKKLRVEFDEEDGNVALLIDERNKIIMKGPLHRIREYMDWLENQNE